MSAGPATSPPLCLLQVHAHPDDEASKGAATTARYADEGVRNVLVCCTGGEEGDILNPAMESPEVRESLAEVRRAELDESVKIIGYAALHRLGYRDSGMPDTEANAEPRQLRQRGPRRGGRAARRGPPPRAAPGDHHLRRGPEPLPPPRSPAGPRHHDPRLRARRRTRPGIPRPARRGSRRSCTTPTASPAGGSWSMHRWFLERGEESPYADWASKITDEHDIRVTTRIDVGRWMGVGREALLAHRTQVAEDGFWFKMPLDDLRLVHPWEEYQRARIAGRHRPSRRARASRPTSSPGCADRRAALIAPRLIAGLASHGRPRTVRRPWPGP